MLPAGAYPQIPASSVGTKFVTSSFFRHRAAINHLIYTPDGRRLLCAGNNGNVSLWNGTNFENELGPGIQAHEASPIRCLAFSHSGLYLLSCDDLGRVKFSKPTLEVLQVYHAHKEPCRSVTFSPTDFKFATGSDDSTVRVFDTFRGQERSLTGHGGDVRWVDWHPTKGVIASCSKDACVKLWDPRVASCLTTLHGHKNGIFQAKWNLNGHWLLTCSRDQLVKLYDVRMLRDMATFSGHGRDVTCCAWHPQHEEVFVSGGIDGSLMLWMASRPDAQGAIPTAHEASVWSTAWHPLGHVLASAGGDQKCQFWCRKRPGDIWQDVYEQEPAAVAAASFAGTSTGVHGGADSGAAAAAAALSSGLLGPAAPGLGRGLGAAPGRTAGAPGLGGVAAATAPASRPNIIPGIGAVLDQLATGNLSSLMASIAPASGAGGSAPAAVTAAVTGGGGGGVAGPRTMTATGSKRGRDDLGGRPIRFSDRERVRDGDRERERERDFGWDSAKVPRVDGPPRPGDGGGWGSGGPPGVGPGVGLQGQMPDRRRGPGGLPPHRMLHQPPYDGSYDRPPTGPGGDGGPGPGPGPMPGYMRGPPPPQDMRGPPPPQDMRGPPPPQDMRRPPPRYPSPHDGGPYEPPGDPHGYGSRGGGMPPPMDPRDGGPGPGPGRPYGGPPPPYGDGPYRGGGGGPPHREPPEGFRHMPPGRDGPYDGAEHGRGPPPPHRHPLGGPPPLQYGPGPGPGRGRGRGRGPPPPGWQGPR